MVGLFVDFLEDFGYGRGNVVSQVALVLYMVLANGGFCRGSDVCGVYRITLDSREAKRSDRWKYIMKDKTTTGLAAPRFSMSVKVQATVSLTMG